MRASLILGLVLVALVAVWAPPAEANPQQAGIQVALRALGLYAGPIDGEIGPQTVTAVRAAQKRLHLPVTGIVDVKTRIALGPLGHPLFGARSLRRGEFGLDVSVLQYLLAKRGLFRGAIDGYLGPATEASLRAYQRRAGMTPNGVVGPKTQTLLAKENGIPVAVRVVHRVPKYAARYVVKPGDTLSAIADRYKLTVATLARVNKLKAGKLLLIGTRLAVPVPVRAKAAAVVAVPAPLAKTLTTTETVAPAAVRRSLDAWSAKAGVSPSLVRALAWIESGDRADAVNGVLQTLPETRTFVEDVLVGHKLPNTTDGDIEVGVLYFRHLLREFKGNQRLALAAWNEGDTSVLQQGILPSTKTFVDNVLALAATI